MNSAILSVDPKGLKEFFNEEFYSASSRLDQSFGRDIGKYLATKLAFVAMNGKDFSALQHWAGSKRGLYEHYDHTESVWSIADITLVVAGMWPEYVAKTTGQRHYEEVAETGYSIVAARMEHRDPEASTLLGEVVDGYQSLVQILNEMKEGWDAKGLDLSDITRLLVEAEAGSTPVAKERATRVLARAGIVIPSGNAMN